ncbi:glycosyltransferase family 2 protein [Lacticaseibacillus paracasei]|uniref:glycosyltransferase family 2 protein n=1 Tax=Lacticaseibacillus paracasei TaxID=1597 RepID=UPI000EB75CD3|nr:glycosyltransferase family A protein [Lacticaseibacillus paracasei]AYG24271.1 glycosyltransferase family 2 protein [Lacticaseibacillus paracasei]
MTVNLKTDVSIIIPAYNAEPFITRCLQSIQRQSFHNFQVLVVENGSTDHTVEKILPFISTDKRFRLLRNSVFGVSNARNLALKETQSKFVTFVDADDYISNNHIQTLMDSMRDKETDMGVTGFSYEAENGKALKTISVLKSKMSAEEAIRSTYDFKGIQGIVCNKIFKKSIIDQWKTQFDPTIPKYEDHKFVVAYLVHCQQVSCQGEITYHYIKHPKSSLFTSKTSLIQDLDVYLTIRKMIVDHGFEDSKQYLDVPLQMIVLNHYWHPLDSDDRTEAANRMISRRFILYNLFKATIKNKIKFLLALLSLGSYWIRRKSSHNDAS